MRSALSCWSCVAELDVPDCDVDDLLPHPATDTVSAVATAMPATTVRETLIASRSFQADSGDTVDLFPNRTVHRFVSPKVPLAPPGLGTGYSNWSRRQRRVLARMRDTCIWDTPIRSAIWLCVIDSKNRICST